MSTTVTTLQVYYKRDGASPGDFGPLELEPDAVEMLEALPEGETPLSVLVYNRRGTRYLLHRGYSSLAGAYVLYAERVPG